VISVYYAVGITCSIFLWIFYLRCKRGKVEYSRIEMAVCYGFTRIMPILMLKTHTYVAWINMLGDLAVFLMLYFCVFNKDDVSYSSICMLYIFNPIAILCMASEGKLRMMAVFGGTAVLILLLKLLKERMDGMSLREFYPEYVLAVEGMFGFYIAVYQLRQTFAQCAGGDDSFPVLLIVAVSVLIAAAVLTLRRLLFYKHIEPRFKKFESDIKENKPEYGCRERFTIKNLVVMLLITALYGSLLLFKLGSDKAPETYRKLDKSSVGSNEILLDFGGDVTISKISIYLGYESKRSFSFSRIDKFTNTWQVFDSKRNIESVFCWNDVAVNQTTNKLGIVSLSDEAYVHEIVILDENGNRLMPLNASYYKELFDEQELFPIYETYYYRTMFDEVYHGRTAYEFVHGLPIYEVSHPPLGKSIIAIGVRLFGMTPFGWRFMCAICGMLMVPVIYMFAWMLSRKGKIAFLTTLLLCFGFMNFTLSRIATIDIIVALFIMLMFFFMYCFIDCWSKNAPVIESGGLTLNKCLLLREMLFLLLCGISTGCAIATKWTGIYAAVGLAAMLAAFLIPRYIKTIWSRNTLWHLGALCITCIVSFIAIPCIIYVWSYVPFLQVDGTKGLIATAIENSRFMLNYHKGTVFSHPYSSEWYEWIVDKQPLLDALTLIKNGKVSTIATFASPVIAWGGFMALLHNIYLWRLENNQQSKLLCIAYMAMLFPWLLIHRTVFIYQYFTCLLILILMLGNSISCMKKNQNMAMVLVILAAAVMFIVFYPVLSGYPAKVNFVNQVLEWFQTWRFV
jgi:4-amino-4-deoxy-L-arabinose transferase-like glycosyltransferase